MADITEKLRAEINDSKEKRHRFVMRKFALASAFLGAGSIEIPALSIKGIDLSLLLYLSPLIAAAFDLYIFTEDYRIKRAGSFIRLQCPASMQEEIGWEAWVSQYPNHTSSIAFFIVSMLMLLGATLVLLTMQPDMQVMAVWISFVVLFDLAILLLSLRLRKTFKAIAVSAECP